MWNGTMFVDLDWPLNASSLLSASAELLVVNWSWKIETLAIVVQRQLANVIQCKQCTVWTLIYHKTSCAACSAAATMCPAPCKWWLEQPPRAFRLEVTELVGDVGHRTPSVIPSLKFVGFSTPKIRLMFGHGVKRPADLDLWPFDL